MEEHTMYCGGCDRNVRVLITASPSTEGQAPLHDAELVCLEIGDQCSGSSCPLGAIAPEDMVRRLLRNGLPLEGFRRVRAVCPSCGFENELVQYADDRVICTACASSALWHAGHAEPM